jgi:hypothetical protein
MKPTVSERQDSPMLYVDDDVQRIYNLRSGAFVVLETATWRKN